MTDNFEYIACKYCNKQLKKLAKQLPGIRKNDNDEPIHQARVATRRLRQGLDCFRLVFEEKKTDQLLKELKKFLKALGHARDLDVQISFLKDFCNNLSVQNGKATGDLKDLRNLLAQKRDEVQPEVIKSLEEFEQKKILKKLMAIVKEKLKKLKQKDLSFNDDFIFCHFSKLISSKFEKVLQYQDHINNPNAIKELHKMRIAAKHLRYTLEIAKKSYDKRIDKYIDTTKKIQTYLGNVHDMDVWLTMVGEIEDFDHKKDLVLFRNKIIATRNENYEKAKTLWQNSVEQGLWLEMLDFLSNHADN